MTHAPNMAMVANLCGVIEGLLAGTVEPEPTQPDGRVPALNALIQETREALGARPGELTSAAAHRLVTERNMARDHRDRVVAERDEAIKRAQNAMEDRDYRVKNMKTELESMRNLSDVRGGMLGEIAELFRTDDWGSLARRVEVLKAERDTARAFAADPRRTLPPPVVNVVQFDTDDVRVTVDGIERARFKLSGKLELAR